MEDAIIFDTPLSIGQKAHLIRISRSLTQEDLAFLVGVKQQEISALERCCPLSPKAAQKILSFLGLNGEGPADG